ncbi:hypothetical protein ACOSP7_003976 [Xanthoceras sorbifolium]
MRLYHRGAAFCKKMGGKLSKMSEKQNIQDHKPFYKDPDLPSEIRDKHRYKLSKLPRKRKSSFARVRNRCIFTGRPRSVYECFRISRIIFIIFTGTKIVQLNKNSISQYNTTMLIYIMS